MKLCLWYIPTVMPCMKTGLLAMRAIVIMCTGFFRYSDSFD